jgi:hypothetical protein
MTGALIFGGAYLLLGINGAYAYQIENLANTPAANDYVVGPGKTELQLDPGTEAIKGITVTNRYGKDMSFKLEIEDFKGSDNPSEGLVLMGAEKGPYSLKDFIHPEIVNFTLKHGERITIPISINVPGDAQPGGLYGSVIVASEPVATDAGYENGQARGSINVISRLASLFFVRVNGDVKEGGALQDFYSGKKVYQNPSLTFKYLFNNSGSVYLNTYGLVKIYNFLGTQIDEVPVQPSFVMPDSSRLRELSLNRGFMMGMYKAVLSLNRGYGDKVDEKTAYFWVLPWKIVGVIILGLAILLWLLGMAKKWFGKNFEIKRKSESEEKKEETEKKE